MAHQCVVDEHGQWTLLEHSSRRITSARDLELVSFLKRGEHSIRGEEMARRAREELNANYGEEDAIWLVHREIPREFRECYLLFPGTVWQEESNGCRYFPFLYWYDGRECLGFLRLDDSLDSRSCLIRPRSQTA